METGDLTGFGQVLTATEVDGAWYLTMDVLYGRAGEWLKIDKDMNDMRARVVLQQPCLAIEKCKYDIRDGGHVVLGFTCREVSSGDDEPMIEITRVTGLKVADIRIDLSDCEEDRAVIKDEIEDLLRKSTRDIRTANDKLKYDLGNFKMQEVYDYLDDSVFRVEAAMKLLNGEVME